MAQRTQNTEEAILKGQSRWRSVIHLYQLQHPAPVLQLHLHLDHIPFPDQ